MASLTDAFSDALGEDNAMVKLIVYAIPVFICAYLYLSNNKFACYIIAVPMFLLLASLMSIGIFNIRSNKREILTFNPILIISVLVKLFLSVLPISCVMALIGHCVVSFIKIPFDIPYISLIFNCIVWLIVFSVAFTSYLSFSKTLSIQGAYNFKVISESSVDVFINFLFLAPVLIIANGIAVGVVWYLFFTLNLPVKNPVFEYYCSFIFMLNVSALSSYFAQLSYEIIRGKDSEYEDNYIIRSSENYLKKK